MRLAHINRFNALLNDAFLSVCILHGVALQLGTRRHADTEFFKFEKLKAKK
jgi:hypothetical protein